MKNRLVKVYDSLSIDDKYELNVSLLLCFIFLSAMGLFFFPVTVLSILFFIVVAVFF